MNEQKTLPLREFAASIGKPVKTVRGWIRQGVSRVRLGVVWVGGTIHVDPRDYAAFQRLIARRREGRIDDPCLRRKR